jgi:hypothetical protein
MTAHVPAPPVLLLSGGKGAPNSHSVRRVPPRRRNSVISRQLSNRLHELGRKVRDPWLAKRCARFSERMQRCATDLAGWRCGSVLCPRCSRRTAIRHRRRVERLLTEPNEAALVTLTLGSTDLEGGLRTLKLAFARLRRRAFWTHRVLRGMAGIELKITRDHADLWNVHLHAVVLLFNPDTLEAPTLLGALWNEVLEKLGAYGSADWRPVAKRRVPSIARRERIRTGPRGG